MAGRHPVGEQPVGSVEPLLVVGDQAVAGIWNERAEDCDADLAGIHAAGKDIAGLGKPAVDGDEQIDVGQFVRAVLVAPAHKGLAGAVGGLAHLLNRAAIADQAFGRLPQHPVKFRPAQAPAVAGRDIFQRQVEQDRSVCERNAPVLPFQRGVVDQPGQFRIGGPQGLDRVRADVQAGAAFPRGRRVRPVPGSGFPDRACETGHVR